MFLWNSLAILKKYYGFVVDEFSKLVHNIKSQGSLSDCRGSRSQIDYMPGSQTCSPNSHGKPHRDVLRVFDVCSEKQCDSKSYFAFEVETFSQLCRACCVNN